MEQLVSCDMIATQFWNEFEVVKIVCPNCGRVELRPLYNFEIEEDLE